MAVSKVILNGTTLIDVTDKTVAASNLLSGETALKNDGSNVVGTYTPPASVIVDPLSVTTNGTYTAQSGHAYSPVTVNVPSGGGGSYPWFGANTVKDYTKTITINLSEDTSWDDWTASTTAATILAAPSTNDFTYAFDKEQYVVWIMCTSITNYTLTSNATKVSIPISTGRTDWRIYYGIPSTYSQFKNLGVGSYASKGVNDYYLYCYNQSGEKVGTASAAYGAYCGSVPSYSASSSGSTVTISGKRSGISARCHTTYFATDRKADIDSANTNIVITFDVYKTPRENAFIVHGLNDMWTAMNAAPEA